MQWRWREDVSPCDPWANMAIDVALFRAVVTGEALLPLVRVYRWDRPSVSVGRLQDAGRVERTFPGLPTVRRPTGGRAVVHGQDLTVSVVTRHEWLPRSGGAGVLGSYRQIAQGLIAAFGAVGIAAQLGAQMRSGNQHDVIDCFDLCAGCDLAEVGTGRKLVGSAQRREGGALLQQMSIPTAPLTDERLFVAALKAGLGHALGVSAWVSVDFDSPV